MSDLNLLNIPVEFVDGQQPTAAFLNAAFGQIDTAFQILGNIIGDYFGDSTSLDTYLTSFVNAIGSLGWINTRLPRDTKARTAGGADDTTYIKDKIGIAFAGKKEAILAFQPDAEEATSAGVTGFGLGTEKDKVVGAPYENLDVAGQWVLDGRRVVSSSLIEAADYVVYPIDTDADDYYDSYAPDSGANVIPNIYDIAREAQDLCTISAYPAGDPEDFLLTFPIIRRIQNPIAPFSTENADTIDLSLSGESIHWSTDAGALPAENLMPTYVVPPFIYQIASAPGQGLIIPSGLVSLWCKNGDSIQRVRPGLDTEEITFKIEAGTRRAIKITVPDSLSGDMPHQLADPPDPLDDQYILVFAGTTIAEALIHERAGALRHTHDGHDDSYPILTQSLSERFDPANWYPSLNLYNHFPQYLHRGGYTANQDPLNRDNAFLGDFLLGTSISLPTNQIGESSASDNSHKLYIGSTVTPYLQWRAETNDPALVLGYEENNALGIRIQGKLYLGPLAQSTYFISEIPAATFRKVSLKTGATEAIADTNLEFSAGTLEARAGIVEFDDAEDPLCLENDGLLGTGYTRLALRKTGSTVTTQMSVGELSVYKISTWDGEGVFDPDATVETLDTSDRIDPTTSFSDPDLDGFSDWCIYTIDSFDNYPLLGIPIDGDGSYPLEIRWTKVNSGGNFAGVHLEYKINV